MGIDQHECLVVTRHGFSSLDSIQEARARADEIFAGEMVSSVMRSPMNDYSTFVIAPSGSKVGWADAKEHHERLRAFLAYLSSIHFDDGSTPFDWILVSYGEAGAGIVRTNCKDRLGGGDSWRDTAEGSW